MPESSTDAITWARFGVGVVSFAALIGIHVWVKELPVWLLGVPGVLMGVDPIKLLGGKK